MPELTLDEALLGRVSGSHSQAGEESGANAPNLLLQIVLPVTLILGLVVSTKIHEYNALLHDLRGDPFHQKYEQAYLEIQKQALLRALEDVQREEAAFVRPGLTTLELKTVASHYVETGEVGAEFAQKAANAHDHLARNWAATQRRLLGRVLARADRVLRELPSLQFHSLGRPRDDPGSELERRELIDLAQTRIAEFTQKLLEDSATTQIRLIQTIHARFANDLERLDRWDSRLMELAQLYQRAVGPAEKASYSSAIFQRLHEKIRDDFDAQGVPLLPRTWEKRGLRLPPTQQGEAHA